MPKAGSGRMKRTIGAALSKSKREVAGPVQSGAMPLPSTLLRFMQETLCPPHPNAVASALESGRVHIVG